MLMDVSLVASVGATVASALPSGKVPINTLFTKKTNSAAGSAHNAANYQRLKNQLASEEISQGHAFGKHVIERGEFPGIATRQQFANEIEQIMNNPSAYRSLRAGRSAYWHNESGTVVIRNPGTADGGTAFKPDLGIRYFLERLD